MADFGMSVRVDAPLDQALERTREALADQGFGILTEIDVAATLKASWMSTCPRRSSPEPATPRWPGRA